MTASINSRIGGKGLENSMMAVITIVNAILIKIALTLRFALPGTSLGAFKKVPITIAGAYSKYPK